jgi:hypothetical protein
MVPVCDWAKADIENIANNKVSILLLLGILIVNFFNKK